MQKKICLTKILFDMTMTIIRGIFLSGKMNDWEIRSIGRKKL